MEQNNLKLISVRIDPDTLEKIDKMTAHHCYWKRNTIINSILTSVMHCFDEKALFDLVKYHPKWNDIEVAQFKCKEKNGKG